MWLLFKLLRQIGFQNLSNGDVNPVHQAVSKVQITVNMSLHMYN